MNNYQFQAKKAIEDICHKNAITFDAVLKMIARKIHVNPFSVIKLINDRDDYDSFVKVCNFINYCLEKPKKPHLDCGSVFCSYDSKKRNRHEKKLRSFHPCQCVENIELKNYINGLECYVSRLERHIAEINKCRTF